MRLRNLIGAVVITLCAALPASGQAIAASADEVPMDVHRIRRALRMAEASEYAGRLRFDAYVEVHATAADWRVLSDVDLEYAAVRSGPPTHTEIMEVLTPRQFRVRGGDLRTSLRFLFGWLAREPRSTAGSRGS